MKMRESRLLRRLRAGDVVYGAKCNSMDPRVVEIAAISGFEVIWLDMEHVPTDWATIENSVRAAKIHDADILVRVARGSYSDYIRALEADAAGIMVPHIMNLEDAKRVVRTTRFYPLGRRPLDGGNQDGAYCLIGLDEYMRDANEHRVVCLQIEDPEAMEYLDEIVALPGIDIVFFGPGDFSHALGVPGRFDDPRVVEAKREVARACRRHGKFAGTVGAPETAAELVELGYRYINIAADVIGLGRYFAEARQRAGRADGERPR